MSIDDLRQNLAAHTLVLLDTMVFSYQLANHARYAPLTNAVLEAVESGEVRGLTTTVTLAKILTVPAKAGSTRAMQDYKIYLTQFPNLTVIPLDNALARKTALVRAETGLRTPDAVQVTAARLAGAGAIVTNDRRWTRQVHDPQLLILDDYVD